MHRRLPRSFFTRPTLKASQALLGKYLVRKLGSQVRAGKIVETEAYAGPQDRASHTFGGKVTPRNRVEYLEGGLVYIYLVYGMYWQLNLTTGRAGSPECVLIRALEPERGPATLASGPGKLCRWLQLSKAFYGEDLATSARLWVEDRGVRIRKQDVVAAARIGIDYAGPFWSRRHWRFYLRGNPAVSQR